MTTINGRTPEEIKRGLEYCKPVWVDNHWKTCDTKCPYIDNVGGFCRAQLMADALTLIQQLENHIGELTEMVQQLERERDAAVAETESLKTEIDAINEDYLSGIHTVREDAQPKWISVEERLPNVCDLVLVIASGQPKENIKLYDAVLIASYWGEEGWIADGFDGWDKLNVTFWMPLPEAPKEET